VHSFKFILKVGIEESIVIRAGPIPEFQIPIPILRY
jgi:hypothetical protein